MTDDFKRLAGQIREVIQNSQNILLHLHPNPDPDSAGSALAMYWALKILGKNPVVSKGDSIKPDWLKFLPGSEFIINQSVADLDLNKFDLFIILDSSEIRQVSKLKELTFPKNLSTVVIDHHYSNVSFAQINIIDSSFPAVGELVYELLKFWQISISKEISANLIAAIFTDTGGFQYAPTSSRTFLAMTKLVKVFPDFTTLLSNLVNNNTAGLLRFYALAINNVETFGNVAISAVSLDQWKENNISILDLNKSEVANLIKSVTGWDLGISMVEQEPNIISISFRTRDSDKYDVSKIALATGFGGGHRAAAGATLQMPLAQAKKFLLDIIYSVYPDLKP